MSANQPFNRPAVAQRQPKAKQPFGSVRKPLANKQRNQTRMSAEAEVQTGIAGKCHALGFMEGDCSGGVQRCHIVSQQAVRDTYKYGAIRVIGEDFWRPMARDGSAFTLAAVYGIDGEPDFEMIALQQILDDNRNLVHCCAGHNRDNGEMVDALDRRKVAALDSYPAGFDQFTHEFRWDFNGAHWVWMVIR